MLGARFFEARHFDARYFSAAGSDIVVIVNDRVATSGVFKAAETRGHMSSPIRTTAVMRPAESRGSFKT